MGYEQKQPQIILRLFVCMFIRSNWVHVYGDVIGLSLLRCQNLSLWKHNVKSFLFVSAFKRHYPVQMQKGDLYVTSLMNKSWATEIMEDVRRH